MDELIRQIYQFIFRDWDVEYIALVGGKAVCISFWAEKYYDIKKQPIDEYFEELGNG